MRIYTYENINDKKMGFALIPHVGNQQRQYNGGNQHFGNQCPQLYQKKAYSGYFMVS
jgi:hypothetical protein